MKSTKLLLIIIGLFVGFDLPAQSNFAWYNQNLTIEERARALVNEMTLEEKIDQTLDQAPAIPRLDVPAYGWWNEALHGVARNGRATVFPQAIGLAATFDEELIYRVATAISDEARAKYNVAISMNNRSRYAGLTFWSPNVNIFRDPRWGRGQETYGEDPYLSGLLGSAFVRGIQGDNDIYLKAAACAKHYLVHSGPEELRHEFDAIASQKDLQETYLPAFKALVVDAKVEGVMGAYNRVNGEAACGSHYFLTELLRDSWGFNGYIVSDCWALEDFHKFHKITNTEAESAALALKSGINLNCGVTYNSLGEAIEQGLISEEELDESLVQLFKTRFRLGFFDDPEANPYNKLGPEVVNSPQHQALARETALKSLVLLKNNNVLPLKKDIESLYVVGPHATSEDILLGNYYGVSPNTVSILDGIVSKVSIGTSINYKYGILPYRENVNPVDWSTGEAKASDAVIAVMGISGLLEGEEGESIASSTKGDKVNIKLPEHQIEYLKKLRDGNDKPLIVIITGGSPIAMPELEELADAILFTWYPGEQGGNAVADVIFGDANPSGRLPITFPLDVDKLPSFEDYSMNGRTYKYMDDNIQFPFGFGKSYTEFSYDNIELEKQEDKVSISVSVTNTGKVSGEEVVQLYHSSPLAGNGDPFTSLIGTDRVSLEPGETKHIKLAFSKENFLSYSEEKEAKILKGKHMIRVGNMSYSARSEILGGKWVSIEFKSSKFFDN